MKRRELCCLLLCAALLMQLLGGCVTASLPLPEQAPPEPEAETPIQPPEPGAQIDARPDGDAQPEPGQEAEPEQEPAFEPPEQAVFCFEGLSLDSYAYLRSGPEGSILLVQEIEDIRPSGRYSSLCAVAVYRPADNSFLPQQELQRDCVVLRQQFDDGTFCLRSREGDWFYFYDVGLNLVGSLSRPVPYEGFFSHDKRYYYYADGALRRYDMATNEIQQLSVAGGLPVECVNEMHPTQELVYLTVDTDPFGQSTAYAVYDLERETLEWLDASYATVNFCGQSLQVLCYGEEGYQLAYTLPESGWDAFYALQLERARTLSFAESGPYLLSTEQADGEERLLLYRLDGQLACADVSAYADRLLHYNTVYCDGLNCLVSFGRGSEEEPFRLWFVNLSQLDFTPLQQPEPQPQQDFIDQARIDRYFEVSEPVELRGGLEYLREYADTLQEQYAVSILFSAQCEIPCSYSDFSVQTTDELSLEYETKLLYKALTTLETTLGRYPEGFFRQFRTQEISGLRIMLVSTIESSYGVVAYEYYQDGWFNIVYDINYQSSLDNNLCHEIWHATEGKLNLIDGVFVDELEWNSLNPEGFAYSDEYETYLDNSTQWTYYAEADPERIYFIDMYSKTYAKEDRARIMEYAMAYSYSMEYLAGSEAIRGKLACMARLIRENFDTSGWPETVYWEQYLQ